MKALYGLIVLLALTACNKKPADNATTDGEDNVVTININGQDNFSEADVMTLANNFADAVVNRDYQKAITYFAPEYVSNQLNDFLEGRVNQFIGEYLFGFYTDESGEEKPITPDIDLITSIKVLSVTCEEDNYSAIVEIVLSDGPTYTTELTMSVEYVNSRPTLTLYGAVG